MKGVIVAILIIFTVAMTAQADNWDWKSGKEFGYTLGRAELRMEQQKKIEKTLWLTAAVVDLCMCSWGLNQDNPYATCAAIYFGVRFPFDLWNYSEY